MKNLYNPFAITALVLLLAICFLLTLLLAGCGGAGTPPIGGGGGGGGNNMIASYTGATGNEIGVGQNPSRTLAAQGFISNGEPIGWASFKPYKHSLPIGAYVVDILADNNGEPSETILATSNPIESASVPVTPTRTVWVFSSQLPTVKGVRYWEALRRVDGTYTGGFLVVKVSTDPNSYTDGEFLSRDVNKIWQRLGYDAWFEVGTGRP